MNEKEYRAAKGHNYSFMASFYESPEKAMQKVEPKSYFEDGHKWEIFIQDNLLGEDKFNEIYFISELSCKMPDELISWIENKEDLESKEILKGDETRNNIHKARHAWIDECILNPGKLPVSEDQLKMFQIALKGFLNMEFLGLPMIDFLEDSAWQVPHFWSSDEYGTEVIENSEGSIKKKALFDTWGICEIGGKKTAVLFDVKSSAGIKIFRGMFNSKYWVQERHYIEGFKSYINEFYPDYDVFPYMVFLTTVLSEINPKTGEYKEPLLSQSFYLKEYAIEKADKKYLKLVTDFDQWIKNGKILKGWKETERLNLY